MSRNINSKKTFAFSYGRASNLQILKLSIFNIRNSIFGGLVVMLMFIFTLFFAKTVSANNPYWSIQSIDTMKYSRDLAREGMSNPLFEKIIESQVKEITYSGATHIAIGTPYDDEFIPFLKKWVSAARNNNLNVWFRGNFSGWEGWFDYPQITANDRKVKIKDFIMKNSGLFEEGDIFTSCTECENGQIGDPRQTGKVSEYRQFLIQEYESASGAFSEINKNVKTGFFSMNADVARLVMDEETTDKLGDVVVIDHYVKDPEKLAQDIKEISEKSGGKLVLGEFGVPIPDIHGEMNDKEQSDWIANALSYLAKEPKLSGVNYWVSFGGTTAIWDNGGIEKPAVVVLKSYFSPSVLTGKVTNEIGKPVVNAMIIADTKEAYTGQDGDFEILQNPTLESVIIKARTYKEKAIYVGEIDKGEIILEKEKEGLFFKYYKFVYNLIRSAKDDWFNPKN